MKSYFRKCRCSFQYNEPKQCPQHKSVAVMLNILNIYTSLVILCATSQCISAQKLESSRLQARSEAGGRSRYINIHYAMASC